jgi:hypothetical protein
MKRRTILAIIGVMISALLVGLSSCTGFTVLELSAVEVALGVGKTARVSATATGMFGTTDTISASSSDKAVATVAWT